MRLPSRERVVSLGAVLTLAAILIALAVLQYRWRAEVSQAARARMQASLQASITNFRQHFYRELAGVCSAFQTDPVPVPETAWKHYSKHYGDWMRTTSHPTLVAKIFVWQTARGERGQVLYLNPTSRPEPRDWPSELFRGSSTGRPQPSSIRSSSCPRRESTTPLAPASWGGS